MKKDAGILMPVLSLPNRFGCGDFGKQTYEFIDMIASCGFSIWQILPLQPLGYGQSPYQPYSSKAMDELYISLESLHEEGLIGEPSSLCGDSERIEYEKIRPYKHSLIRKAYENFKEDEAFVSFSNQEWVRNYAVFLTFKKSNNLSSWQDWDDEMKFYPERKSLDLSRFEDDIRFEIFVQYVLLKQWKALLSYAHSKGIQIMGDVPFYVGLDSDDVWSNKDKFLLDENGSPLYIAGVPADSFSVTGQRWGNPIYDWDKLSKDGFSFWCDRLGYASSLYDITRIDHFRAFETYWRINADCPTALDGIWVKAPGYEFFDTLFSRYPEINIVAEDLGDYMDDVYVLRDHFGLKGMVITQQMFEKGLFGDSSVHSIVYTGTHDNDPIRAWFEKLDDDQKAKYLEVVRSRGINDEDLNDAMNRHALSLSAETAVLSMPDILRLSDEGRINLPGSLSEKNWSWRIKDYSSFSKELDLISQMLKESGRSAVL